METLLHDMRQALRRLRTAPAFTIATILTLALGIGATTSIFTLVHAVLLKSLPVANPGELYRLAVLALGLSALVASFVPAFRASLISPLAALRAE